jgi:DNA-binding transcriptional ArsR family regulator
MEDIKMAETAEKTTRQLVEELFDKGTTDAGDIAEKLGKPKTTVYVHLRKIAEERGLPKRGRGRPPKAQEDGEGDETPKTSKPKASSPKAARPAPTRKTAPKAQTDKTQEKDDESESASGNGHVSDSHFPIVKEAVQKELALKKREVEALERMLAGLSK